MLQPCQLLLLRANARYMIFDCPAIVPFDVGGLLLPIYKRNLTVDVCDFSCEKKTVLLEAFCWQKVDLRCTTAWQVGV